MENMVKNTNRSRTSLAGWIILTGLNALLIVNSVLLYFFIATEGIERTVSILMAGFGMFGLVIAQEGFRIGFRKASRSSWITTIVLLALGVNISIFGDLFVGIFYLALAAVALLGQLLTGRT